MNSLQPQHKKAIALVVILLLSASLGIWWFFNTQPSKEVRNIPETEEHHEDEVILSPDLQKELNLNISKSIGGPLSETITFTGTVEANQYQIQNITSLLSGRVEHVYVALGQKVRKGDSVVELSSPQAAEMHGKLHEAETRLQLARVELERVKKAENRATVLKAKAELKKSEADRDRLTMLEKAGVAAKKDVIAANTNYDQAKAEFEYQSDIALNREIAKARAELATADAELTHVKSGLQAVGGEQTGHGLKDHDTSKIMLRSPMTGTVIERFVNPGIGIDAGKPLFTIADLSNVWIIANVPESQIQHLSVGFPAKVKTASMENRVLEGKITYIDPQLDKETRTAKVRIETDNPGQLLKVEMFVEVAISIPGATTEAVWVPDEAIQNIRGKDAVFVPVISEPGHFKVKEVVVGDFQDGKRRIKQGLSTGQEIVVGGGFKLKSILLKEDLGEGHGH
ncbi:MAG: efflux RND transporter periplasmic adaptor subunit [Candidatus Obscuribacterales bacterium]|nr:efflux RND transporter periplasmic adaptor subunit [Candidatus Obscuribacterales bacterium]